MNEFKGTPGPWVLDERVACVAIYPKGRESDTNGCHADDERNIAYSRKGAEYDDVVGYWSMDKKTVRDFTLMAAAPELLESLLECMEHMIWMSDDAKQCYARAEAVIAKALGK
ncbi:hypothetical protein [Klebsiella quasipneumoniae]|uniref:hypothetical protein n=1 Tax=Klebsiella quasipneumoniae TaxID=1463165 RepID=UPI0024066E3E|nr:hypothetical protein [Klebsiella quasipneumoniae]MDG0556546.1 hypothetical protein [Klebsiella quasipneumoniae]